MSNTTIKLLPTEVWGWFQANQYGSLKNGTVIFAENKENGIEIGMTEASKGVLFVVYKNGKPIEETGAFFSKTCEEIVRGIYTRYFPDGCSGAGAEEPVCDDELSCCEDEVEDAVLTLASVITGFEKRELREIFDPDFLGWLCDSVLDTVACEVCDAIDDEPAEEQSV